MPSRDGVWLILDAASRVDLVLVRDAPLGGRACRRYTLRVPIPMPPLAGTRVERVVADDVVAQIDLRVPCSRGRSAVCSRTSDVR